MFTATLAIVLFLCALLAITNEMHAYRVARIARQRSAEFAERNAERAKQFTPRVTHAQARAAVRGGRDHRSESAANADMHSTAAEGHRLYRATVAAMKARG